MSRSARAVEAAARVGCAVAAILAGAACGLDSPSRPAEPADASPDAPIDATPDAPIDAGDPDAMIDAMPPLDGAADAMVDATPPACVGGITGGSHIGTVFFPVSMRIGLDTGFYDGWYESAVFDGVSPTHEWTTIAWTPARPYGKPLPDNNADESSYYDEGGANTTGNLYLAHFDEAPGAVSFEDASSASNLGECGTFSTCPVAWHDNAIYGRSVQFNGHDDCPMTACCVDMTCGDCTTDAGPPDCPGEGGDRIDVPDSATLEPANVTVEAWVAVDSVPDGFSTGMVVAKGNHPGAPATSAFASYSIEYDRMQQRFKCYFGFEGLDDTQRTLVATTPVIMALPQGYRHVACTYDGAFFRIYIDGTERASAARTEPLEYADLVNQGLYIGAWNGWQYLDGFIDELAIFDRALTPTEIRDHALRGMLRLRMQVRSCPTIAACASTPWAGPDGTEFSYYSEVCRPPGSPSLPLTTPTLELDNVDCDLDGLADHPSPDPPVVPNRYVQYRARLQSPSNPLDAAELQLLGGDAVRMSYTSRILRAAALLAIVVAAPALAGAQTVGPEEADRLVEEGEALARGGDFAGAVGKFKEADGAHPRARHDCYVALAYHRMGREAQAAAFVGRCRARATETAEALPDWADRLGMEIWKALSAAGYGRVTVTTAPADASVTVDGFAEDEVFRAGEFWLPPGEHTFTVSSPGWETKTEVVSVKAKEKLPLDVRLPLEVVRLEKLPVRDVTPPGKTEPLTRPRPRVAYITLLTGVAVLGAGAYFHYRTWQTHQEAEESAAKYDEVIDRFRTERIVTLGLYSVGAVATGVGAYLLWRHASSSTPMVGVDAGSNGAQVWTGWTF